MSAMTYYHYTNKKGYEGITQSQRIRESTDLDAGDDASFGPGVYLTTVPPSKGKKAIITTCWGASAYPLYARNGRIDYVIQIQMPSDKARKATSKRDVCLHEGILYLTNYTWDGSKVPNKD